MNFMNSLTLVADSGSDTASEEADDASTNEGVDNEIGYLHPQHSVSAVRRLQFCAGHRVFKHESKCHRLHGHNYVAFFHAQSAAGLDSLGRVIDFGVLKEKLSEWISDNWDHGFILWKQDYDAISAINKLDGQQIFLLPTNPTAENMAAYLLNVVAPAVLNGTGVVVNKIVLWETENCFVEVVLNAGL